MDASTDIKQQALARLDDGLELVLHRDGARWQVPARSHLYFEVSREKAEAIFEALNDRFQVRRMSGPSGRKRVLTPEPVAAPEPAGGARSEAQDTPTVRLIRTWHTCREIARRLGVSYDTVYNHATKKLTIRRAPVEQGGTTTVVRLDGKLVQWLRDRGAEVEIDLSDDLEPRDPYPEEVKLTQPCYTYAELAEVTGREPSSVGRLCRRHDVTRTTRPSDGRGRDPVVVDTTAALADAIESSWHMAVTIAAEARREVAA
jgi:AcrR family transcriptional regulator